MKKIIVFAIALATLSSCVSNFDVVKLDNDFKKVQSKKKKPINIDVYWSENDVKYDFDVIYESQWNPFTIIFFHSFSKRINNSWVDKATKNCKELKGDAVIMRSPRYSTVIKYRNRNIEDLGVDVNNITIKEFSKIPVAYLGVDYSNVKFVGIKKKEQNIETLSDFTLKSNSVFKTQQDKYRINKYFGTKNEITPELDFLNNKNKEVDLLSKISKEENVISEQNVEDIIKNYNLEKISQKIAVVLIAENISKSQNKGTYWLVVVNTSNNNIINKVLLKGDPGGKGFSDYWIMSINNALLGVQKNYNKWLKKANKK